MKIIKVLLVLICATPCLGQSDIYVRAVFGSYQMNDLKDFQDELLEDYENSGVPVKAVSNFPASLQAEIGMDFPTKRYTLGGFFNYAMTQGKIHYGDYSGETFAAQKLNRILLGIKGATPIARNLDIYGKLGANLSTLILNFETTIQGAGSESEKHKFKALGISIEPGIQWKYPYGKFQFLISAGYEFNFNDKTKYEKLDADTYLIDAHGDPVSIEWGGLRAALGVAYSFGSE